MNPFWLFLIVPASVFAGYMIAAFMFLAKIGDGLFDSDSE